MSIERKHIDWLLFLSVSFLMLASIAFVYSASATIASLKFGSAESLFIKHAIRIIAGIFTIVIFSRIDYHLWFKYSKFIILISISLLIVVLFTSDINNVSRWISIGPVTFQPTEFAKFALIIHFSALIVKKQDVIREFRSGFLPFIFWLVIVCFLIALEPNFSNAALIFVIGLILLFLGNLRFTHLIVTFIAIAIAGTIYITSSMNYRLSRIVSYIGDINNPSLEHKVNYQLNQSLIALGNGGWLGVGAGQSRQSQLFLPESYGDFIFAIIGEEYGFIGILFVLLLFLIILMRGFKIAKNAPDMFGYYLASGFTIVFGLYVFINAGVNCGLLPTTGLPMPFVSYGGTAVIIYAAAIGILLNISKSIHNQK